MPELPEVEAIRRQLEPHMLGHKIVGFDWILPRMLREGDPDLLIGATIAAIQRKGKHLIIKTDRPTAIFVHLRMTGTLLAGNVLPLDDKFLRARVVLDLGEVRYRDIRTLGGFWIRPFALPPWKSMALDPLEPAFSAQYLFENLKNKRIAIKQALLDQAVVAGIGNIYASEILFRSRIHPAQPSNSLNLTALEVIARHSREVLEAAIAASGTTFRDFRLSDGREGEFQDFLQAYGKSGKPCPVCKTGIERFVQGQRSSFYCPKCQPLLGKPLSLKSSK